MSSDMVNNHSLSHHHNRLKQRKIHFIDKIIYSAVILMPLMTIPQIISIWSTKSADGVSVWTWGMFTFFSIMWLWYAIVHKEKPLIINNILWILMQGSVLVGILLY